MPSSYAEQLPSQRWSGVVEHPETGKRFRVKDENGRTFVSQLTAERYARAELQRLQRLAEGEFAPVSSAPTFAAYGPVAINRLSGIERSTRSKYLAAVRSLVAEYFGDAVTVTEINRRMVREMIAQADSAGIGAAARAQRLHVLRHVMNAAIDDEYREGDPTHGVKVPAPRRRYAHLLSEDQLHYVGCLMPMWMWPAVLISHDAGLRISEVVGLRRENVNPLKRTLYVANILEFDNEERDYPKGKEAETLPMSERLTTALDCHLRNYGGHATGYLFVNPATGKRLTAQQLRRAWDKARVAVGADETHWHDLRHGCAQVLVNAGHPLWAVQMLLRHKSPATTMRYVNNVPFDRLAGYVGAFDGASTAVESESPRPQVAAMR